MPRCEERIRGRILRWGGIAAAAIACSTSRGSAPSPTQPQAVFGTPDDFGGAPFVRGEPLVEVAAPSIPTRCDDRGWLFLGRAGESVLPTRMRRRRPQVLHPLPEGAPAELAVSFGERRVIEVAGGVLVAIDNGEFGAGLYHLATGAAQAEALDSHLSERIHWIGQTRDRIFGVAGLCHGVACDLGKRTVVFEVRLDTVSSGEDMRQAWRIDPVTVLHGCPDVVDIDEAGRALLIATCHGLFRVDELEATLVASWPSWLGAVDVAEVRGVSAPLFFVSFGALIGRFGAGRSSWFSTPECVQPGAPREVPALPRPRP
jgi:hypothetical protein